MGYNIDRFDWGILDSSFGKENIIDEIFVDNIYERFFQVEEGDIVVDIGASVGPFTYNILHKKPKHVYCLEPSELEFPTLVKNTLGYPVTPILKGIDDINSLHTEQNHVYGNSHMESITFKKFKQLYNIDKIDFLKTDCEGGEYSIFTEENLPWVKNNIKKIVGEWHLSNTELKPKFRYFRDNYLSYFHNYEVYSVDGVNIKWDLWNEHFLEYYTEVIIYINNK
jgi:FkbM family methyltransferase